jgi:hypothetical protein
MKAVFFLSRSATAVCELAGPLIFILRERLEVGNRAPLTRAKQHYADNRPHQRISHAIHLFLAESAQEAIAKTNLQPNPASCSQFSSPGDAKLNSRENCERRNRPGRSGFIPGRVG